MATISYEQLVRAGTCEEQFRLFIERYGIDPVEVTEDACVEAAPLFDFYWAANRMLSSKQWDIYDAVVKSAEDAYYAALNPARDAFDAATRPAWDAYRAATKPVRYLYDDAIKQAWDEYEAAVRQARDAYEAATKPAGDAYAIASAQAFARAYNSPR